MAKMDTIMLVLVCQLRIPTYVKGERSGGRGDGRGEWGEKEGTTARKGGKREREETYQDHA